MFGDKNVTRIVESGEARGARPSTVKDPGIMYSCQ